jgi:WD40 repeat protein
VLHKLESSEAAFEAVVISPDDKVVAANSSHGPVIVWDTASGKLLQTLTGHVQEGDSMDFRPDGKILATGNKDKTIAFWDTTTWKKVGLFIGNDSRIESLMYSPDGQWLANGGGGGSTSIKLWPVTGKSN